MKNSNASHDIQPLIDYSMKALMKLIECLFDCNSSDIHTKYLKLFFLSHRFCRWCGFFVVVVVVVGSGLLIPECPLLLGGIYLSPFSEIMRWILIGSFPSCSQNHPVSKRRWWLHWRMSWPLVNVLAYKLYASVALGVTT